METGKGVFEWFTSVCKLSLLAISCGSSETVLIAKESCRVRGLKYIVLHPVRLLDASRGFDGNNNEARHAFTNLVVLFIN